MKEVKTGIVGLGRLGAVHAENLAFKIPGCRLVAACSLEQKDLDWAKEYLKVDFVTTDYKKMVDEIIMLVADTLSSNKETIRIAGEEKSLEVVKRKFMKLKS